MKDFEARYLWEDAECRCQACLRIGTPHGYGGDVTVTADNIQAALAAVEGLVRSQLPQGVPFEILSIRFVWPDEISASELSLLAEAEFNEDFAADDRPEDWRHRLDVAGARGEAEALAQNFLPEDKRESFLNSIFEHGPWGHHMIEWLAELKMTGQLKPGLYAGIKALAARLE